MSNEQIGKDRNLKSDETSACNNVCLGKEIVAIQSDQSKQLLSKKYDVETITADDKNVGTVNCLNESL